MSTDHDYRPGIGATTIQLATIARRSVKRTLRQPYLVFPSIAFPLLLLTINSKGFAAAVKIQGFPTHNYLDFALATPFMQAALFSATNAGGALAEDIEKGFLNRLALTPMRGAALVVGQLAGSMTVACIAACCYVVAGLALGASIHTGVVGVVVLILLAALNSLTFAGIGALLALRTGSPEAVQGMFPLLFVSFFLSSINLPRPLIRVDWFRAIATWNPVSYMVEGMRSVVISSWSGSAIGKEVAVTATITALALFACSRLIRTRLVRT
jgi:ABC-2 type transport system permease protein